MSDRPSPTEAGAPHVDVHVLSLGKKKGDESFVEGYRRSGPEGLTREVVVLEVDDKGATKVGEKVRQLLDKKLTSFVVDLAAVPALEGAALKEFVKAKKLAEEKGGYFSIAGAKEAVAGLLKVMGLDKEIASHNTVAAAVDQFKFHLQTKIAEKVGAPAPTTAAPAPAGRFVTGEMVAVRPEGRLAVEQIDGDFLFYPPGKKPAKKDMAGDTPLLALPVRANNVAGLADEVRRAATAGTNRIVANLFELAGAGPEVGIQIAAAVRAAEEKKAKIYFSGANAQTQQSMRDAGVAGSLSFDSEVSAAEQLAVELLEQKQKKGVRLKRVHGEIASKAASEERKPAKTMQMATPSFDEDEGARPAKTAQFAAPKFDEDDEPKKPGKTQMYAAPTFDEDEGPKKPGKTVQMAAPKFDEDDEPKKPGKTQMYAAPTFDEDEGPKKPGKTVQMAAPKFDEDDEPKKAGKTQVVEAPTFFEEGDISSAAKKAAEAKADVKGKTDPNRPGSAMQEMKTQAIAGLSKEEALRLAAEASGKPMPAAAGKPKTDPARPTTPPKAPEPPKARTEPMRAAMPAEGIQEMKTQAIAGLSKEEALRLAAEASGKPTPAASGKPKTDPARPTVPPKPPEPQKGKTEPLRAAMPAEGLQEMKTQAMSGLSKEEALRLAAEASGKGAPPAAKAKEAAKPQKTEVMKAFTPAEPTPAKAAETSKPQKTEVMKAFTPAEAPEGGELRVMKTEAMAGLTREDALRLAAEASGKTPAKQPSKPEIAAKPQSKPDIRAQKTEVLQAAVPDPSVSQVARTEMLQGLSKEEAMRLAAQATGKVPATQSLSDKKTGEIKAKTDPNRPAAPVQKTEQLKAFDPNADAQAKKTGEKKALPKSGTAPMMAAMTEDASAKPAGEPIQGMKTEAMPGLTREEALKLAKSGGKAGDIQEFQTDRMQSPNRDQAVFQSSKTQAFDGMTREQAEREAKTDPERVAQRGDANEAAVEGEAKGKKSPILLVGAVAALVLGVAAFFLSTKEPSAGPVDVKKLEAADKKIEAALLDAIDFDGNE